MIGQLLAAMLAIYKCGLAGRVMHQTCVYSPDQQNTLMTENVGQALVKGQEIVLVLSC